MSLHFHPLRVKSVVADTDEAVIVSSEPPSVSRSVWCWPCVKRNSCASDSGTSKETITASSVSAFGSTACKATYRCLACGEPFEHFKPI